MLAKQVYTALSVPLCVTAVKIVATSVAANLKTTFAELPDPVSCEPSTRVGPAALVKWEIPAYNGVIDKQDVSLLAESYTFQRALLIVIADSNAVGILRSRSKSTAWHSRQELKRAHPSDSNRRHWRLA
jgi:hypothetical protein